MLLLSREYLAIVEPTTAIFFFKGTMAGALPNSYRSKRIFRKQGTSIIGKKRGKFEDLGYETLEE